MKSNRRINNRVSTAYWLKRLKHFIKRNAIILSPHFYWKLRYVALGYPEPELPLIDTFCSKDMCAVDVGANYGMYSYYASKRFPRCYAFEPQSYFVRVLARAFPATEVEVFQVALSNTTGTGVMRMPLCDRGYSTIDSNNILEGKVDESDGIESFEVKTNRLDDFQFKKVGFLKVDVEGHELEVLQGAVETITSSKPAIYVEIEERHRTGSVQSVVSMLSELGYDCFFLLHKKLLPFSQFDRQRNQDVNAQKEYVRNFIFFHHEKRPQSLFPGTMSGSSRSTSSATRTAAGSPGRSSERQSASTSAAAT